MEELLARHRKEQKELQGKITSKKKNATKKTRKGVNDECERLERELEEKQAAEIAALAPSTLEGETAKLHLSDDDDEEGTAGNQEERAVQAADQHAQITQANDAGVHPARGKKPNRQKARLARRAAEQEAQMEAAAQEAATMPDQRQQEMTAMKQQMENRGLTETLIRPDGHCLYSACAHTIPSELGKDYKSVRAVAADYISAHPDDFAPFMDEPIESYTHKIKDTAEWGGHLELQAIAKAFNVAINVLHATGQVDRVTPEQSADEEIWLAYYQHSFGLGEHYNALRKAAAG